MICDVAVGNYPTPFDCRLFAFRNNPNALRPFNIGTLLFGGLIPKSIEISSASHFINSSQLLLPASG